jgi:general secretion pathway protein M
MANEWLDRGRAFYAERSPRERMILLVGGFVLLVLVGYGTIYEPVRQARGKLAERLPTLRAELRLMRVQAAEIERLRTRMGNSGNAGVEQRVKSSAAAFGVGGAFTQFTLVSNDQVQLTTQPLPPGAWIDWLADLERQGITVTRCHITGSGQPGLASVELTLRGGR